MERFYFHIRANGALVPDHHGRPFNGEREACDHATRCTPLLLRKCRGYPDTHVSIEICGKDGTIAVIRGTVILEKWTAGRLV
jgi:hypothetical protein